MRTLRGELIEKGLVKKHSASTTNHNKKKRHNNSRRKKKEKLSNYELENLMGVYKPRYEKRNGVIRQK